MMEKYYVSIIAVILMLQAEQLYASSSRPPLHPGATIAEQDAQKMHDEYLAVMQQIAACSVRKSPALAHDLRIATDFTELESDALDQICKEPNMREKNLPQSTTVERAWHDATRRKHPIVEHVDVFSPPLKVGAHGHTLEKLLIVTDFEDEDL